jgi:putative membrane-bound dehydrogenase-like protein
MRQTPDGTALIGALVLLTAWWGQPCSVCAADGPLPPATAVQQIRVPEGFTATLYAAEPDVVQPIAMAFDDRGRLWVVECLSYPDWQAGAEGPDRVVIFEDTDGDGRHDARRVFWDRGRNLTGIELGVGGVFLCSTPELLFIPDADQDGQPDGPPQAVLDGWDLAARHNFFNGLAWGPDGWLYGCNGILANARVGPPGTPDPQRVYSSCGVWRYHPYTHAFEVVAHGTTNPWGLDFDERGELFITNCVIKHLWHVIPGGHYERMFGRDPHPHAYELMKSCADHLHWAGGDWQSSRGGQGAHDQPGGGHAHAGCLIYQGGQFPPEYHNSVFMANIHGNRLNRDLLLRSGSGYVARHAPDFMHAHDPWFRGLVVKSGPDGAIYVSDWSDTGECHDYDEVHRTSGRIWRIAYTGNQARTAGGAGQHAGSLDLAALPDAQLVALQRHANVWHVQHARRLLAERARAGRLGQEGLARLRDALFAGEQELLRLRALWCLYGAGAVSEAELGRLLSDPCETLRAWAVRLAVDAGPPSERMQAELAAAAEREDSPYVRLHLACALQRLPDEAAARVALPLVQRAEDANDANLPLALYYGCERLADAAPQAAARLAVAARIPLVRQLLARRLAAGHAEVVLAALAGFVGPGEGRVRDSTEASERAEAAADVLAGLYAFLRGRRGLKMPEAWPSLAKRLADSPSQRGQELAVMIGHIWGDAQATSRLVGWCRDPRQTAERRGASLAALIDQRSPELAALAADLLDDEALRAQAIAALAVADHPETPQLLLARYPALNEAEQQAVLGVLASRASYAHALLDALEKGRLAPREVTSFVARQIDSLGDAQVSRRLRELWGEVRPASQTKQEQLARYRALLTPDRMRTASPARGRRLFAQSCAACHKLFGEGGSVGPDLTGSQRTNLDYVLENLIDPNAIVGRDYLMTLFQTTDGRVLHGMVLREDDQVIEIRTPTEQLLLARDEIEVRQASPLSLMPEGQLDRLSEQEVCDLIAYLASPQQVAAPSAEASE